MVSLRWLPSEGEATGGCGDEWLRWWCGDRAPSSSGGELENSAVLRWRWLGLFPSLCYDCGKAKGSGRREIERRLSGAVCAAGVILRRRKRPVKLMRLELLWQDWFALTNACVSTLEVAKVRARQGRRKEGAAKA